MSHIQIFDSVLETLHASSGCGKYLCSQKIIVLYINSQLNASKCEIISWFCTKGALLQKNVQLPFVTFNLSCRMAHFGTQIVPSSPSHSQQTQL